MQINLDTSARKCDIPISIYCIRRQSFR